MHKKILKDKKYRLNFNFSEKKKIVYSYICFNTKINIISKKISFILLKKIPSSYSKTFIKNRCIRTGRGRAVLSLFKVSRHEFKRLTSSGYFSNIHKK
jgi:ribosomal protein S14